MSPDTTAFLRQFSRAQWKASADEDDKRRLGVITSRNGPEWQCTNWSEVVVVVVIVVVEEVVVVVVVVVEVVVVVVVVVVIVVVVVVVVVVIVVVVAM
ncbi:hypothetical protein ElyMa_002006300 [Elysia marginata]|uniref:Uncharacterized protein n=1 Tax=Elysia marginata TaxID=1093978 RepID=A0AAV4F5N0_9GAST|nr:hypothetical protein ElyMa_002006300 [Elysia marginata]